MLDRPAKIVPPVSRPSRLKLIRTLIRNPIEAWPRDVYHADVVRTEAFGRRFVYLMDPELVRALLVDEADALVKSRATQRALGPVLGRGLLTADGGHWRWQRRATAPAFRPDRIDLFLPAMLAAAQNGRDRLSGLAPGATIDLAVEMMRITFDIILETMLSGREGFDVAKVQRGIAANLPAMNWAVALSILGAPAWTPHPGKLRAARGRRYLDAELARTVAERRRRGASGNDLLTLLIAAVDAESDRSLSDRDIIDNLQTFIAAGHETTALALTWTPYLLALYPEAEARVAAEIAEVSGGGPVQPEHIARLSYTRQVLLEAMRLYPPAPIISREASRDIRIGDVFIAADTTIFVPVYAIHRHHRLWPEPERFDPERFAPDAAENRHRYSYLPFGAGPRICIGMNFALQEATAILAVLLGAFRFTLPDDFHPRPRMTITLRPSRGMPMRVTPRRA